MNIKHCLVALSLLAVPAMAQDAQAPATDPAGASFDSMLIPTVTINPDADNVVHIARAHSGQVLFPAIVNGRDLGWWMLDSGASDNVIDVRAAKELGLESAGSIVTRDFSGLEQTSPLLADLEIVIGNCTIVQPRIAGVDMLPIATMVGQPVIGIIGASTLSQIVLDVDFITPEARFYHPDTFEGDGLNWTDVAFDNNCPVVQATYEGVEGSFVVDTGFGLAVNFSRDAVIEQDLLADRESRDWTSVGVGSRKDVKLGFLDEFEFFGQRFTKMPAIFEDPSGFSGVFPEQTGMIGSLILRHYVTTFDLGRARVAFTPVKRAKRASDLFIADIVGTYRDQGSGGTMVITWDGEKVTVILGVDQPELEIVVLADKSFYFPAAWITGSFHKTQGVIVGLKMKLPDGESRRAFKID